MVLTAAAAFCVGFCRDSLHGIRYMIRIYPVRSQIQAFTYWQDLLCYAIRTQLAVLMPFSVATFVLRMRSPRPRRSRSLRQPGTTACVTVIVVAVGNACALLATATYMSVFGKGEHQFRIVMHYFIALYNPAIPVGSVIMGVWLFQAVYRRWQSDPSWVDRVGRSLGVAWILVDFQRWCLEWIHHCKSLGYL